MQPEKQAAGIQCAHNSSRCRIRLHSQMWDGRVGCSKLRYALQKIHQSTVPESKKSIIA